MSKCYTLGLLLCLTFFNAYSQQPCATQFTPEMRERLISYSNHRDEFSANATSRETYYIPLKIHIVGTSNATKYYRLDFLWDLLCELNQKYAETGFYFYLYEDVQFIANDAYFNHDFTSGSEMMLGNNVAGAVNVYIVEDPAGYCGYYTYYEDAITIAKSCSNPMSTTLAHELGHYFSLPHPFTNVTGVEEYVDGSNCETGGDLFCDTRADFLNYRWPCPYTGNDVDDHGDIYNPDETLFMSYSYDNCQNQFSQEQMNAMVYDVLTYRQDLLNHPAPSVTPVTEVPVYIYPKDSAINVPNDWVAFDWEPVADADFYNLQVTYTITFASTPMIDVNVEGTAYTTWLLPDKTYRWRVIPVKSGNTCVPEVPLYTFTTVMGTGIDAVDHSTSDLTIYPTLNYTNSSFHFTFNSTAYASSQLHFISMDGRVVKQEPVTIVPGDNSWEIPVAGLSPGMYIVRMVNDGKVFQGKVVVGE